MMLSESSSKHLDPVVLPVCHQDVALAVDSDALQTLELTLTLTPSTESSLENSFGVEHLDPVVSRICHINHALFIYSNSSEKRSISWT